MILLKKEFKKEGEAQVISARKMKKFLKFSGVPLAIFTIVLVVPFVNGFFYTFTDWNGFKTTKLVGFQNYADSFADPKFWSTLQFTALFVVVSLILVNIETSKQKYSAHILLCAQSHRWCRPRCYLAIYLQ
jgi:ABC-type polysaccharide transport system permease subunit